MAMRLQIKSLRVTGTVTRFQMPMGYYLERALKRIRVWNRGLNNEQHLYSSSFSLIYANEYLTLILQARRHFE